MTAISALRHHISGRRRDAELQRILRHADPRVRAELIAITRRDASWQ